MREIAAEQFIRTFAAEADRRLGLAELGKKPDRKRSGVGRGLIRVICEFLNRISQVDLRIQIQFLMIGLVSLRRPREYRRFRRNFVPGMRSKKS